jgi:hypothetical protein
MADRYGKKSLPVDINIIPGRRIDQINPVLSNNDWFKIDIKSASISAISYTVGYLLHGVAIAFRFPMKERKAELFLPEIISELFPCLRSVIQLEKGTRVHI